MTIAYSGDSITFPDNSVQATAPKVGMVNRIINGAMVINQRGYTTGSPVNPSSGTFTYVTDRFGAYQTNTSKMTLGQSTVVPSGFINSLNVTSSSAYSVPAGELYMAYQAIEGYNIADLGWGTASAKTVTVSFQVYSSLTGTFGGAILNGAFNRSYPFTYSIAAANTWTQITLTIPGDTTGTWLTTNGIGMYVSFGLGMGSTYSGTAGAWAGAQYWSATGAVSVVGTSGATFYITGVQLEKGSTATSFDYRPYGTELGLCQRYYELITASGRYYTSDGVWGVQYVFKTTMRANPTYTDVGGGVNSVPTTNQGIISGSTQEAGIQWAGVAGTYYVYARAASFNAEL